MAIGFPIYKPNKIRSITNEAFMFILKQIRFLVFPDIFKSVYVQLPSERVPMDLVPLACQHSFLKDFDVINFEAHAIFAPIYNVTDTFVIKHLKKSGNKWWNVIKII